MFAEKLYNAKVEWSRQDAVASQLEETKKSILGSIIQIEIQSNPKISIAKAEWIALSSKEYIEHITKMTNARMEAHIKYAKVQAILEEIKENERQNIKNAMDIKYGSGI